MRKIIVSFSLISFLLLSLSSCSMVSIGYDFGDWLLKKRILKFVKFYSPQQKELELILDDFMAWHKLNALDLYLEDIRELRTRFLKGQKTPLDQKEIAQYLKKFRQRYFESFRFMGKKMVPLLVRLNGDQIERTKVLLGRKLDEKKEKSKIIKTELKKELERKWMENLEEWFGPLRNDQRKFVKNNSASTFIDPLIVWSRNGKRTNDFINIFDDLNPAKRAVSLENFFLEWENEDFYSSWRNDVSLVLATFIREIDEKQRKHFLDKLDETLELIGELKD